MVTQYAKSLLDGLVDFFALLRSIFECLPMPIQALCYLAFGGFLFICILHMIFIRGWASVFKVFWNIFSWMPPPLEILCQTVVMIFLVICLVQIIKLVVEILKMIFDVFGGLFGKVVDLFKWVMT